MLINLYISQIPNTTTEHEIYEYFSNFGQIKNLSIAKGKGNWNKLNAKVDLQCNIPAKSLLTKKHFLGGSRVIVDKFLTGEELEMKNKSIGNRRVSLFGIKGGVTTNDVLHYLRCFGEIESHHFIKYKDKRNKKYGFVTFMKEESARKCFMCQTIEVNGLPIKIKPYKFKKPEEEEEQAEFVVARNPEYQQSFNSFQRLEFSESEQTDPSPNVAGRKKFNISKFKEEQFVVNNYERVDIREIATNVMNGKFMEQFESQDTAYHQRNTIKEILDVSRWIDECHYQENLRMNKQNKRMLQKRRALFHKKNEISNITRAAINERSYGYFC